MSVDLHVLVIPEIREAVSQTRALWIEPRHGEMAALGEPPFVARAHGALEP